MLKGVLRQQFQISYYVKGISYSDTESMAPWERMFINRQLRTTKKEEHDAIEEARKKR
jgi:hypothetical protein